jgi:hypothetical protein
MACKCTPHTGAGYKKRLVKYTPHTGAGYKKRLVNKKPFAPAEGFLKYQGARLSWKILI